jgi:hypothetical protein
VGESVSGRGTRRKGGQSTRGWLNRRRLRPDAALVWGRFFMRIYPIVTLSGSIGTLARFALASATAGFAFSSA